MKVAIVGSRDYPDLESVRAYVRTLELGDLVISGGARGVDQVAEAEARRLKIAVRIYPADWDKHGKSAGFLRSLQIVDAADEIVAFWDGQSRGTAHAISLAKKSGKPISIYRVTKTPSTRCGKTVSN